MKGFKDFVMRGNLVELAVAFIMAAAFAAVVTTFTNWLLSLIPAGATNFGDTKFGLFLTALVSFLVIAVIVYFSSSPPTKESRRVSESRRPRLRTPTTSCCLRRSATCSPPIKGAPFDPAAPLELATQQCASLKRAGLQLDWPVNGAD
jgi:large conductance mechanosensitive channel